MIWISKHGVGRVKDTVTPVVGSLVKRLGDYIRE